MRLRKSVFREAAKRVSNNPEWACIALSDSIDQRESWKKKQAYYERLKNTFGPKNYWRQDRSWWGPLTPRNQLARSLGLLFCARMGSKDEPQ